MPTGAIFWIYLSSCFLRLLIQSGPVLLPCHCISLNFMCWWECPSVVKCLKTGVDSVILGYLVLEILTSVGLDFGCCVKEVDVTLTILMGKFNCRMYIIKIIYKFVELVNVVTNSYLLASFLSWSFLVGNIGIEWAYIKCNKEGSFRYLSNWFYFGYKVLGIPNVWIVLGGIIFYMCIYKFANSSSRVCYRTAYRSARYVLCAFGVTSRSGQ